MTSNDFEAAAHLLHTIPPCAHGPLDETACGHCSLTALAALGWGPKPTVSRKEMERHLFYASPDLNGSPRFAALLSAAMGAVMAAGIEVTP